MAVSNTHLWTKGATVGVGGGLSDHSAHANQGVGDWNDIRSVHRQQLYLRRDRTASAAKLVCPARILMSK